METVRFLCKSVFLVGAIFLLLTGCSAKKDYVLFHNNECAVKSSYLFGTKEPDYNNVNLNSELKNKIVTLEKVKFEYKILPHDRVKVKVYKHPEFSTSSAEGQDRGVLVDSDGYVNLLLVGKVHIQGLTQNEASDIVQNAFGEYLKYPSVQLEVANKKVYILGEVEKPGELEIENEKLSLLKLLAKAGDLTDNANRQNILVFKQQKASLDLKYVNLTNYNSIKMANMMIEPNDIVYVTPKDMKAFNVKVNDISPMFSLIGQVLSPFVSIKYLTD